MLEQISEEEKNIISQLLAQAEIHKMLCAILRKVKSPEYFSKELAPIFKAFIDTDNENPKATPTDVYERLSKKDQATAFKLITETVGSKNSISNGYDCGVVATRYLKRLQRTEIDKYLADIESRDPIECGRVLADALNEIDTRVRPVEVHKIGDYMDQAVKNLVFKIRHPNAITGVATGFKAIDRITRGFQPGNLIIIAARPAMGKTAFALSMALNIARGDSDKGTTGIPAGFISIEMTAEQLAERIAVLTTAKNEHLSAYDARFTDTYADKVEGNKYLADDLNLFINDKIHDLQDIRSAARSFADRGAKIIFIDYLQLIENKSLNSNATRENVVSSVSRALKALAKELDIPIVALAQVNRQTETRTDTTPKLADLRESGAIEQDADFVAFLHRPEYYDKTDLSLIGEAQFVIAKNRHGATETVDLSFIKEYALFTEKESPLAAPSQAPVQLERELPETTGELPF